MDIQIQSEKHIVVFSDHNIRRTWHNNEWWFSIIKEYIFGTY